MSWLFGSQPKPQPVVRMPDSQSPDVLEAARRQRLALTQRGGRSSTILSGQPAASGSAPVYSNSSLSGAS